MFLSTGLWNLEYSCVHVSEWTQNYFLRKILVLLMDSPSTDQDMRKQKMMLNNIKYKQLTI